MWKLILIESKLFTLNGTLINFSIIDVYKNTSRLITTAEVVESTVAAHAQYKKYTEVMNNGKHWQYIHTLNNHMWCSKNQNTLIELQQLCMKSSGLFTCSKTSEATTTLKELGFSVDNVSMLVHSYDNVLRSRSFSACEMAASTFSSRGSIPNTSPPSLAKGYKL